MYEEDFYKDSGVAFNTENFDDDIFTKESAWCDGCYADCMCEDDNECPIWRQCKKDNEEY